MNIDAFKNNIGDEFDVFNNISSDNKLLVALYNRYKKCVENGGDDCLDVAIGTIREFFEQVKQDVDEEISEEDLFDMYEDYFEQQEELEYYEEKYNEWMEDQEQEDAEQIQQDHEQAQEEDILDDDEITPAPAPTPEPEPEPEPEPDKTDIEKEREEYLENYEDKVGDITDKDVPMYGSYENYLIFQSDGFIYSYDGKELYWNDQALQDYYMDFYNYLVSNGIESDKTDSYLLQDGNTSVTVRPIGIEGEEASNFLLAYYYTILSAYASDTSIVISDSAEQSVIWSDDLTDEQNDMLNLLWSYYQSGNIESVKSIITLEQFADGILNTIQGLDSSNDYEVSEGFYENMAYVQYIMEDLNEDASYSDVLGYMVENYDTLDQSKTSFDSVIDYYEETGDYVYDDKTDTLMTIEVFNDTYNIERQNISEYTTEEVAIMGDNSLDNINEGINNTVYVNSPSDATGNRNYILESVNVDGEGNITYYINRSILQNMYPDLYADLDIGDDGSWSGEQADGFFSLLFYSMYQSYLVNGDFEDAYGDSYDFWTGTYTYGLSDTAKEYLEEIVNWYSIYGNFDDITESTDYAQMVYYLSMYADMNAEDAERGTYVLQDDGTYQVEGSDGLADGWESTFLLYNYISYYFGEVYEDYTTDDVLNYINENGYDINTETLVNGIVEYYNELGYQQDEDGNIYKPDDEDYILDTTDEEYLEFVENASSNALLSDDDMEDYYRLYKDGGYETYNDFANAVNDLATKIYNRYLNNYGYDYDYDELVDYVRDYIIEYGLEYDKENISMDVNGNPALSSAVDDVEVDTTSEEYLEFVEKMGDKLGDIVRNILDDDATSEYLQSLYVLYVNRDTSELKNYNQFAEAVDNLHQEFTDYYGKFDYNFTSQLEINELVLDYINEYGYEFDENNFTLDDDGSPRILSEETQEAEDKEVSIDGYYYTQNKDGTYDVYEIKGGEIVGQGESFADDTFMTSFGDIEFSELTDDILKQVETYGNNVDEDTLNDKVEEAQKTTTEKEVIEEGEVGNHITDVNNSINNLQITENMGEIKLNQRKPTSQNLRYGKNQITIMGVNYDGSSRIEHIPDESEMEYQTEGGNKILRLDGSNRKLTREEWRIIEESYLYDKDISKPFIIDKMENPQQFAVNYNNVFEYYFELSNRNRNFFVWLDSYKAGEEGRSYVNYRVNSKLEANNVDINDYVKRGSILDLLPSVDFTPHFHNQGSQAQEKAILETHALGIQDVNAFILSSSLCSLFSNIIMENAKHIGKNTIIQNIESNISQGEYEGLKDNVYTGIYKDGSQIEKAINQSTSLTEPQKNILNAIFNKQSFKSIADYQINNRYGEIVFKFFGTNDERKHKLENNSGKVLFELGLILLAYYASMMDNDELMGIDTNEKSNLIKITSEFLETLYPSKQYDGNLLTGIDNIMNLYTREIRNLKRGTVANEITAEDLLRGVVRDMIDIAMNETPTTFNVYDFFDERLLGHISNNFGLDMYMKIGTFDSFVEFIADGFIDSQQFNSMIKFIMTSTMGERFNFKGNEMLETLFMSSVQSQTFINSSKFNLLIPVIHPEIIDLVPPSKVNINLFGFNAKILGFVEYNKKTPIYDTAIQEDINFKTTTAEQEPTFITEEDAEKRAGLLGLIGTHQHDDGTYMVGENHEQLEEFYDNLTVNNGDFDDALKNIKDKNITKIADEEHRIMVEDKEDIIEVDTIEMGEGEIDDYKLAGILEILNQNPDDIEKALKNGFTDFDNIELIKPSEGDNYVIIKDGKNVYVAFRGSRGIFEYEDWYGDTGNLMPLDTSSFYSKISKTLTGQGENHRGFKKGYEKMKTELIDNLNDTLDKDTNLYIIGHSRGTAFGDQLVEDAIRIHPKDKIKYRGFGYITHRNKENAEQMNEKIKDVDYITYHIAGDPLRVISKVLPYHPVGKNKLITGYEMGFTGNPFMSVDVNALGEIKEDEQGFFGTLMSDAWRVLRTPVASQHFITGYKNLLAQDKHEFKFRDKQEKTYFTGFSLSFATAMIGAGALGYKRLQNKQQEIQDREAYITNQAEKMFELEDIYNTLQAGFGRGQIAPSLLESDSDSEFEQPQFTEQDIAMEETQQDIQKQLDEPDIQFEKGGIVDDGKVDKTKVESYEYGGMIPEFECEKIDAGTKETHAPSYEYGGLVPEFECEKIDGGTKETHAPTFEKGGKVPDNVVNPALYKKAKAKYANMKHSAYKSSLIVKDYKKRGGKYRGSKTKKGLTRWHKEKWRNQRGEEGYKKKGDIYRPTKRISEETPTTMNELSKSEIQTARKKKKTKGRVDKFEKGGSVKSQMPCNKPQKSTRDDKKTMVKACDNGKEKLIHFGDPNMTIKKHIPGRRKNFRARHKCDTDPPDKLTARYWSCKAW